MTTYHLHEDTELNPFACRICGREGKSWGSLSHHIINNHPEYNSQSYYDEFLATEPPSCKECGTPITKFRSISKGYIGFCSNVCRGVWHRRDLANDEERNKTFVEKVAINQSRIWTERREDGADVAIRNRISDTANKFYSQLTDEERKEKCGWMNKLTDEEKQRFVEDVLLKTGMHRWHKSASDEELRELYDRRSMSARGSKHGMTGEEFAAFVETLSKSATWPTKEIYYDLVWMHTERTYRQCRAEIDPESKRGTEWHLDHEFSIAKGWVNQIDPKIIGSKHNLRVITATENAKKSHRCSITLEVLVERYQGCV